MVCARLTTARTAQTSEWDRHNTAAARRGEDAVFTADSSKTIGRQAVRTHGYPVSLFAKRDRLKKGCDGYRRIRVFVVKVPCFCDATATPRPHHGGAHRECRQKPCLDRGIGGVTAACHRYLGPTWAGRMGRPAVCCRALRGFYRGLQRELQQWLSACRPVLLLAGSALERDAPGRPSHCARPPRSAACCLGMTTR